MYRTIIKRNTHLLLAAVLLGLYLLSRGIGLSAPYYQDEYKYAFIAEKPLLSPLTLAAHPPLAEVLFRVAGTIFGSADLRIFFVLLGLLSIVLMWFIIRSRVGERAAWWTAVLLVVVPYNVLASLMVDLDGQVIPALFLLLLFCFDRCTSAITRNARILWLILTILCALIGLLIKLSFVLAIGVILIECFFLYRQKLRPAFFLAFVVSGAVLTFVARLVSPTLFTGVLAHAQSFSPAQPRQWGQIIIQTAKAIFYLGPLLMMIPLLYIRDLWKSLRPFIVYLLLSLLFYLVLFDFSRGSLDKYLMVLILPMVALAGATLATLSERFSFRKIFSTPLLGVFVLFCFFISLLLLPHEVYSLYPKTQWFYAVTQGSWNFLIPFTGGSGPAGFYMSWLFIAVSFIITILLAVCIRVVPRTQFWCSLALFVVGFLYMGVFSLEYIAGPLYGNSTRIIAALITQVEQHPEYGSVITYNDAGAYELIRADRYEGRFYAAPQYEAIHRERFSEHLGYYIVDGIPLFSSGSFYTKFFSTCKIVKEVHDKMIIGRVYDCRSSREATTLPG